MRSYLPGLGLLFDELFEELFEELEMMSNRIPVEAWTGEVFFL
jgi:hypothetical protein